jgi:hypothetical protein
MRRIRGIGLGAGKSPEELKEFLTKATYADARPGGWDPAERVKDNALDGVINCVYRTKSSFHCYSIAIRLLGPFKFVDRRKNSVDPPRNEFRIQPVDPALYFFT